MARYQGGSRSLTELATLLEGDVHGDPYVVITGVASIEDARPGEITFAADVKKVEEALASQASAVIVPRKGLPETLSKACLAVDNPRLAFAKVLEVFTPRYLFAQGIHPTAVVSPEAEIGSQATVMAHAVIEAGARIGQRAVIYPGVYIGNDVEIGDDVVLHANVVLREQVKLGSRVIVHAGTVIGADGFGYVPAGGRQYKVPQIGIVEVEDDVEIGANTTIDRATCGVTRVGKGSKIDNLVQVGHNVQIGENCLLVAQSGVAGSSILENRVTLAGKAGVAGHLKVGSDSVVAANSIVAGDLPPGSYVFGIPARPHHEEMRVKAAAQRLPDMVKNVRDLGKRVEALEGKGQD